MDFISRDFISLTSVLLAFGTAILAAFYYFSEMVRTKRGSKDISREFQLELDTNLDDFDKTPEISNEAPSNRPEETKFPRLETLPIDAQEWVAEESKARARDTAELVRLRRLIKQQRHDAEVDERRYRLLRAYATQGLTQSKISFNTSLSAAALGFVVILVGVVLSLLGGRIEQAIVPVIGGAVIDAVSLLFFVQDRRHQKTMFDFFERLREDRKLDEALTLLRNTPDEQIRSRVQAAMVLHFAGVPEALHVLGIANATARSSDAPQTDPATS
jgi:TRADD-N domain-containing protein